VDAAVGAVAAAIAADEEVRANTFKQESTDMASAPQVETDAQLREIAVVLARRPAVAFAGAAQQSAQNSCVGCAVLTV